MQLSQLMIINLFVKLSLAYGFDGCSDQAAYKQKFDGPGVKSNNSLFATTVIHLRLVANNNLILWNNQAPQSIQFCRLLELEYEGN